MQARQGQDLSIQCPTPPPPAAAAPEAEPQQDGSPVEGLRVDGQVSAATSLRAVSFASHQAVLFRCQGAGLTLQCGDGMVCTAQCMLHACPWPRAACAAACCTLRPTSSSGKRCRCWLEGAWSRPPAALSALLPKCRSATRAACSPSHRADHRLHFAPRLLLRAVTFDPVLLPMLRSAVRDPAIFALPATSSIATLRRQCASPPATCSARNSRALSASHSPLARPPALASARSRLKQSTPIQAPRGQPLAKPEVVGSNSANPAQPLAPERCSGSSAANGTPFAASAVAPVANLAAAAVVPGSSAQFRTPANPAVVAGPLLQSAEQAYGNPRHAAAAAAAQAALPELNPAKQRLLYRTPAQQPGPPQPAVVSDAPPTAQAHATAQAAAARGPLPAATAGEQPFKLRKSCPASAAAQQAAVAAGAGPSAPPARKSCPAALPAVGVLAPLGAAAGGATAVNAGDERQQQSDTQITQMHVSGYTGAVRPSLEVTPISRRPPADLDHQQPATLEQPRSPADSQQLGQGSATDALPALHPEAPAAGAALPPPLAASAQAPDNGRAFLGLLSPRRQQAAPLPSSLAALALLAPALPSAGNASASALQHLLSGGMALRAAAASPAGSPVQQAAAAGAFAFQPAAAHAASHARALSPPHALQPAGMNLNMTYTAGAAPSASLSPPGHRPTFSDVRRQTADLVAALHHCVHNPWVLASAQKANGASAAARASMGANGAARTSMGAQAELAASDAVMLTALASAADTPAHLAALGIPIGMSPAATINQATAVPCCPASCLPPLASVLVEMVFHQLFMLSLLHFSWLLLRWAMLS